MDIEEKRRIANQLSDKIIDLFWNCVDDTDIAFEISINTLESIIVSTIKAYVKPEYVDEEILRVIHSIITISREGENNVKLVG